MSNSSDRYLELLKKSLLNQLYLDNELRVQYLLECVMGKNCFESEVFHDIIEHRKKEYHDLIEFRKMGWSHNKDLSKVSCSRTMLGELRLENIEYCIRDVIERGVPGDVIECGVWRGGGVIFMKALLEVLGDNSRVVWVADSFQGLPKPTAEADLHLDLSQEVCPHLAVSRENVKNAFISYDLLDDRVKFLEGWFKDALPTAPIKQLAVLRLDGDLYSSTVDVLEALYDAVSPGGYIIVDDYFVPACRKAVDEFRKAKGIVDQINEIDWTGIYWKKSA